MTVRKSLRIQAAIGPSRWRVHSSKEPLSVACTARARRLTSHGPIRPRPWRPESAMRFPRACPAPRPGRAPGTPDRSGRTAGTQSCAPLRRAWRPSPTCSRPDPATPPAATGVSPAGREDKDVATRSVSGRGQQRARFEPKRWTSDAAVTFASRATSASVSFAGPSRAMARNAACRISMSVFWRGRLMEVDYKRPLSLCLISKWTFIYDAVGEYWQHGRPAVAISGGGESRRIHRHPDGKPDWIPSDPTSISAGCSPSSIRCSSGGARSKAWEGRASPPG